MNTFFAAPAMAWGLIQDHESAGLPFQFSDPLATNYWQRCYRVLLGP